MLNRLKFALTSSEPALHQNEKNRAARFAQTLLLAPEGHQIITCPQEKLESVVPFITTTSSAARRSASGVLHATQCSEGLGRAGALSNALAGQLNANSTGNANPAR
jgi:hypothetical protein